MGSHELGQAVRMPWSCTVASHSCLFALFLHSSDVHRNDALGGVLYINIFSQCQYFTVVNLSKLKLLVAGF